MPDLFREGSGAVAEGRLQDGTFVADTILAKHDERYMPPELGNLAAEHKAGEDAGEMIAEAGLAALWLAAGLAAYQFVLMSLALRSTSRWRGRCARSRWCRAR